MNDFFRYKPTLLEQLRTNSVVVSPNTPEECWEKARLIIEHKSEFPSTLRPVISNAALRFHSSIGFLSQLDIAVIVFFANECVLDGTTSFEWQGRDNEVDTDEEVELLIRLFPRVLTEKVIVADTNMKYVLVNYFPNPVASLLFQEKVASFFPLFAELGIEVDRFKEEDRFSMNNLFGFLQSNSKDFLSVMKKLKEKGLVEKNDTCALMLSLFSGRYDKFPHDFFETNLRFLIDWNPNILVKCGRPINLLHTYAYFQHCEKDVRIFEVIIELGMSHYPWELGFVFHKITTMENSSHRTFFEIASIHGPEWIKDTVRDKILRTVGETNTTKLQDLVISAATNDEISLDGLYTLIRYDPMTLSSQCLDPTTSS